MNKFKIKLRNKKCLIALRMRLFKIKQMNQNLKGLLVKTTTINLLISSLSHLNSRPKLRSCCGCQMLSLVIRTYANRYTSWFNWTFKIIAYIFNFYFRIYEYRYKKQFFSSNILNSRLRWYYVVVFWRCVTAQIYSFNLRLN